MSLRRFYKSQDGPKLNGWFIRDTKILFFAMAAPNISHRIEKLRFFRQFGCNVFIFDYRGYGKSKGNPSEKGLYADIKAAYDYLISQGIASDKIIGYGESLGGAVIIDLASKNIMRALIIDSSFSSVKDMVKSIYPFLPHWIFASRFDSISKIKSVSILS